MQSIGFYDSDAADYDYELYKTWMASSNEWRDKPHTGQLYETSSTSSLPIGSFYDQLQYFQASRTGPASAAGPDSGRCPLRVGLNEAVSLIWQGTSREVGTEHNGNNFNAEH